MDGKNTMNLAKPMDFLQDAPCVMPVNGIHSCAGSLEDLSRRILEEMRKAGQLDGLWSPEQDTGTSHLVPASFCKVDADGMDSLRMET